MDLCVPVCPLMGTCRMPVSCSATLHPTPMRQGLSLKLERGWCPASPSHPPVSALGWQARGHAGPSAWPLGAELRSAGLNCKRSFPRGHLPTGPSPRPLILLWFLKPGLRHWRVRQSGKVSSGRWPFLENSSTMPPRGNCWCEAGLRGVGCEVGCAVGGAGSAAFPQAPCVPEDSQRDR